MISNLKNEDNECFKLATTRALNLVEKNAECIDIKFVEKSKELNWKGFKFPVNLNNINNK